MCSGKNPAFMPNPTSINQNSGASAGRCPIGPSAQLPVRAARSEKKANSTSVPVCDAAR